MKKSKLRIAAPMRQNKLGDYFLAGSNERVRLTVMF